MNIAIPVIITVLGLAGAIVCQVFAWKRTAKIYWVETFVIEVVAGLADLMFVIEYNTKALSLRDAYAPIITDPTPYSRYAVLCTIFCVIFLGLLIISVVLAIGKSALRRHHQL